MNKLVNNSNYKIIGILGGMGPYATVMFTKNIIDLTEADKDWDHIHTVIDNNVHIPSRSRAILYGETSPLEGMIQSCLKLQNYPVDAICMPCNSACYWADQVQRAVKIPIINIVSATTEYLFENYEVSRVIILGGMVTYQMDLYKDNIREFGAEYVKPSESLQKEIVELIESVKKSGDTQALKQTFANIVKQVIQEKAVDCIILACTEFTEFKDIPSDIPIVDSSYALAKYIVDYAKYGKHLYLNTNKIKSFWDQRAKMLKNSKVGLYQSTMLTSNEEEAKVKWELEKSLLLNTLKPYLLKNCSMLELGCGHGRWTRAFSPFVREIDAYDYSSSFIKIAREITQKEKINNIKFICSNIEDMAFKKQYDFVVSIAFLHYLNDRQFKKTIEIIKNSVKTGGLAVFRESCGYNKRFELHGYYSSVLDKEYSAVYRTSKEIIQSMGKEFSLVMEQISLSPTKEKSETCQKIILLEKG